jgi:hypothetical protein
MPFANEHEHTQRQQGCGTSVTLPLTLGGGT